MQYDADELYNQAKGNPEIVNRSRVRMNQLAKYAGIRLQECLRYLTTYGKIKKATITDAWEALGRNGYRNQFENFNGHNYR